MQKFKPYENSDSRIVYPENDSDYNSGQEFVIKRKPSRILQHYHPRYDGIRLSSSSKKTSNKRMLETHPSTDINLWVAIDGFKTKSNFEPLFGCICLCMFDTGGDTFKRVSENFYFDNCSNGDVTGNDKNLIDIKTKFPEVYDLWMKDFFSDGNNTIKSTSNPAKISPVTSTRKCMFSVPKELKTTNLFLVWYCSKILTTDTDKALLPYISSRAAVTSSDKIHEEACKRLFRYKQPLGFGVKRLFCDGKQLFERNVNIPIYPLKGSITESALANVSNTIDVLNQNK